MNKLTLDGLDKLRDTLQSRRAALEGRVRASVTVHMGTCGISAGARKVMTALLQELDNRGITDVRVMTSGCAGLCSQEPMATVQIKGEAPVKYVGLDEKKTIEILEKHVLGGAVVTDYALAKGSERVG